MATLSARSWHRSIRPGRGLGHRRQLSFYGSTGARPHTWQRTPIAIALAVLVTLIGVPAATRVARGSGMKDPQFVVIDEVAGQLGLDRRAPGVEIFLGLYSFSEPSISETAAGATIGGVAEGIGIVLATCRRSVRARIVHLFLRFGLLR